MKTLILTLAIAFGPQAQPATAANEDTKTYAFGQTNVEFVTDEKEQLSFSKNCLPKKTCAALGGLPTLSLAAVQAEHPGTQAAGSLLCEKQLKGIVVLGLSQLGDENAFCRFAKDKSLVDLNSLVYRARQNDEAAPAKGKKISRPTDAAPANPDQP
jgi:hypothetical protein